MTQDVKPRLLRALAGETLDRPPIWFMRQAGRFLPEYRELRARAPDFMVFCKTPDMAAEATLQPLRRFAFDAAIVFADILVVPEALGQKVWFEAGEGPRLGDLPSNARLADQIDASTGRLAYVGETLARVRAALEPERALIGFAGGPWTVATYMLEGRSSDRSGARSLAYTDPERVQGLVDLLADATARYLAMQAKAGAQALKIFESWAEQLPEPLFERLVIQPHATIVRRVREMGVDAPVIGFPRGAGALVDVYAEQAGTTAVALDVQASAEQGRRIQKRKPVQGALDPLLLRAGGPELERRIDQMLTAWGDGPYVFNLGHGILPDTPVDHVGRAVRPFLFKLFSDPAIITLPAPARLALAALISTTRTKSAQANYARMGGASPLLPETVAQAGVLEAALRDACPDHESRAFIAMRYWNPTTEEAARAVEAWGADEIVLLPLYPQFSTTTTESSLKAWRKAYRGQAKVRAVCCYPLDDGLIDAHAERIRAAWTAAREPANVRLLFSAHGLPEKIVQAGDPYQAQVEATAEAVAAKLGGGWDWTVCYQSRVGRLQWLGPSTTEAIAAAGEEGKGVIVSPISFVSEHIETLVELDHDYAVFARDHGVEPYIRVPALGVHARFVEGLALAVKTALERGGEESVEPGSAWRCGAEHGRCPCREGRG